MPEDGPEVQKAVELILLRNIWNLTWLLSLLVGLFLIMLLYSIFQLIIILSPIIAAMIAIYAEGKKGKVEKDLVDYTQILEEIEQKRVVSPYWILLFIIPIILMIILWLVNYMFSRDPIISFVRTIFLILLITIIFISIIIINGFSKIKKIRSESKLD